VLTITSDFDRNQWRLVHLFTRDYNDVVGWFDEGGGVNSFGIWKNSADGNSKFTKIEKIAIGMYCIPAGLYFIDINSKSLYIVSLHSDVDLATADGLDDMVCVAANSNMSLAINKGDGNSSKLLLFSNKGIVKKNEGYAQDCVRLGDIDGDGRADYGILDDSGNIRFWRNEWINDTPVYWQLLGSRFTAKGMGDGRGVRFEDINGDCCDDWIWVSDVGATTTWTNTRSCKVGRDGDGLNVAWRQGFYKGALSGPIYAGVESYITDTEKYLCDRILFGRIFSQLQDFGLLGRQDCK
jgi:hypothetical protein